ncbi:unnamed protein product [Lampetra fluviatilis]
MLPRLRLRAPRVPWAPQRCAWPPPRRGVPARSIYSETGQWEKRYTAETRAKVERWWRPRIQQICKELSRSSAEKPKSYVLSMFPYPSGKLHMGHVRVYTISDAIAHFHRMNGKQVLHPMGWDAFGLPAENAAIERGLDPEEWTTSNIAHMRTQLQNLGLCFDWDREIYTCKPEYYRWTQYLFVKLFEAGLAYQKEALVNWDPVDQTVLADEQVDESGRSWRSGAVVEQRYIRQWFLRTTAYAKALLDGLQELPAWHGVRAMQANWLGDCSGCFLHFPLEVGGEPTGEVLPAFTYAPEAAHGASHLHLLRRHRLLHPKSRLRAAFGGGDVSPDTDVLTQVKAVHPFTGQRIPVVIAASSEFEGYLECMIGIPGASPEDAAVAEKLGLERTAVLESLPDGTERVINSEQLSGLERGAARDAAMLLARRLGAGGHATSAKLRDWLVSRQRYWGTPIPVVHCAGACGAVAVPPSQLPVHLPRVATFTGKGASPLLAATDWLHCRCPKCGGPARRETDTMDTFVDSAWYFLRYTDPDNDTSAFSRARADRWMPVDVYVGGKEHAVMHLYYARFLSHFCHDQGMVATREPFRRLLVQGLIKGQTFRLPSTGQFLPRSEVLVSGDKATHRSTGQALEVTWEKMSKSKHNGVEPDEVLAAYGLDTARLFLLYAAPPEQDLLWDSKTDALPGVLRWQVRLWALVSRLVADRAAAGPLDAGLLSGDERVEAATIREQRNLTVRKVTAVFEEEFLLNSAISRLIGLSNVLTNASARVALLSEEYEEALATLCLLLAPLAPHLASELWRGVGSVPHKQSGRRFEWDRDVLQQPWPTASSQVAEREPGIVNVTVRVNNVAVGSVPVPREVAGDAEAVRSAVLLSALGAEHLAGRTVHRAILSHRTPLINFLVEREDP